MSGILPAKAPERVTGVELADSLPEETRFFITCTRGIRSVLVDDRFLPTSSPERKPESAFSHGMLLMIYKI